MQRAYSNAKPECDIQRGVDDCPRVSFLIPDRSD